MTDAVQIALDSFDIRLLAVFDLREHLVEQTIPAVRVIIDQ